MVNVHANLGSKKKYYSTKKNCKEFLGPNNDLPVLKQSVYFSPIHSLLFAFSDFGQFRRLLRHDSWLRWRCPRQQCCPRLHPTLKTFDYAQPFIESQYSETIWIMDKSGIWMVQTWSNGDLKTGKNVCFMV